MVVIGYQGFGAGGGGGRASELKVFEKGVIGLYAMPVWRGGGAGFLKRLYRGI